MPGPDSIESERAVQVPLIERIPVRSKSENVRSSAFHRLASATGASS